MQKGTQNPKSLQKYTHKKVIRDGLMIFKKPTSIYWTARIYTQNRKYITRSTREIDRLDATDVAKEIAKEVR